MKDNKKKKISKKKGVKKIKVVQIKDKKAKKTKFDKADKANAKAEKKSALLSPEELDQHRRRVRIVMSVVAILVLIISATTSFITVSNIKNEQARQSEYAASMEEKLAAQYEDYEKEIPKIDFNLAEIKDIEDIIPKIYEQEYDDRKELVKERIERLKTFAALRDEINGYFDGEIMKSSTSGETVTEVGNKLAAINESYRDLLSPKHEEMKNQRQILDDLDRDVRGMFEDDKREKVRNNLNRNQYNEIKGRVEALAQRDVADGYADNLKTVDETLKERQRLAEEARKKAEEERRRREAEIAAAWHVLNVPYWSQNGEGVKNGCEAASLLMGLQYKGYLKGMNLRTYAELMPKSEDPNTGFRGKIFEGAGSDAPFWIAPAPLAAFGRSSSGNSGVQNITGASLDQLDAEVAKGNPVIIYLTFTYVKPSEWRYGAPKNLHVMLLTGYNSKTGMQRTTDPFTIGGKKTYDLPKKTVESIYNSTGKRAVVIR